MHEESFVTMELRACAFFSLLLLFSIESEKKMKVKKVIMRYLRMELKPMFVGACLLDECSFRKILLCNG